MKYALLIGINYIGTSHQLAGCLNDVRSMGALLTSLGWQCTVMADVSDSFKPLYPARRNIIDQIRHLISLAKEGDSLFLHYSGHGTYTMDDSDDEDDGRDEELCPVDGGTIVDDEIRAELIDQLPPNVSLFAVFDCCFSGTVVDLRYSYEDDSSYLPVNLRTNTICNRIRRRYRDLRLPSVYSAVDWIPKLLRRVNYNEKETPSDRAQVMCISGCRDSQTSADTSFGGIPSGALTGVLLDCLRTMKRDDNSVNVRELIQAVTSTLKCLRYEQVAQLSLGRSQDDAAYQTGTLTLQL